MKLTKILGIAMVAALALAVTASAASAEQFHAEGTGPFEVKASQVSEENHVFTIENGLTTKCKKASFTGTQAENTAATLTVTPVYSECTAFGLSATVNMAACDYTFASPEGKAGSVAVTGCEGTNAKITAGTCEVQLNETGNGELSQVLYTNQGTSPSTVKVDAEVSGITYNKTKDGFLCPLSGTGSKSDGKYDGATNASGFAGEAQVGIFVE